MGITKIRGNNQIKDLSINNNQIAADANIELSKIAESEELLKRDGSVPLTGDLDADGNKIENLGAPVGDNDAARKIDIDSAVSDINVDLSALEARMDTAETDIDALQAEDIALDGRLDVVEAKNVEQDGRLDSLEAEDIALDGRLDVVEAKNVEQDGRLDSLEAEDIALDGRLDVVEAKNVEQDGRLDTAEADIVALEGRMDTAETDIDALQAEDIALDGRLDVVEAKNVEQDGRLDAVEAKNVEQDGRLDTAEADIVSLEGRMDTAETDIDALQAEDIALDGRLDVVEAKNVEQDGRLDVVEAKNVEQDGRLDTAESDIDALQAEDIALDGRLDVVEAKNVEQDGRLDSLEAEDIALDGRLDVVEAKNVEQDGRLDVAEADIVSLEGRMDTAESDIVSLEGRMDTAESDIDALESGLAQEILDRQAGDIQAVSDANAYTDQKITDLVNGAPAVLDTLKELADALNNDENFAVTIAGQISGLQSDISDEETARIAADNALDARIDVLEADLPALDAAVVKIANVITRENPVGSVNGINEVFTLANLPIAGSEHVYLNGLLQEPNSTTTSTVTDIDWEVGVGGDFASLELALADANVLAGDNILIKDGTYTVSAQINVNKGVRIFGESLAGVIFETPATAGAPVYMFNVTANDVVMKDLTIKHKKTSNTSVESAVVVSGGGFPQTRVSGFMMDNCVVEYMEFGVVVRGSDWKIVNSNISYTGPNNSTRRGIGIYGIQGTCYVKGISINNNASTGNLRFCTLLSTTGTNPNETYVGTLVVEDCVQVSGALSQFISQDSWQGSAAGFNLIVKNNNVNEGNAFISFFGTVANFGDIYNEVTVSGNTLSNLHGGTPAGGKGVIGVDGSGGIAFRSSNLPVHASSNTLSNLTFRTDYAEATGSSGSLVGHSIANIAKPTINQDAVIGSSPTAPATPEMTTTSTVVVENDYGIVDDVITFNDAPLIGDRIRVSYIKQ